MQLIKTDFAGYLFERNDLSRLVTMPNGDKVERVPCADLGLVNELKFLEAIG